MKIQIRSIASLPALALLPAIALLLPAPVRAESAALGPDMPAWTIQPYAEHESEGRNSEKSDEGPTPAAAPAADPFERTLASTAKAEDLIEAGRSSEALAAVNAALLSLDGASDSEPEVKALREKLRDLRERCEKRDAADEKRASPAPSRLKPVKAERNERVDKWIDFYSGRGRDDFQKWLGRSGAYMDLLMHHLRAEGVPEELANLVFVESGFNMHARSVARAVGPWQFIRGTAKIFGLKMTPYVDQRRDPELATRAAARYLRRLYGMFDGSWPLALAAYNSGEGTVMRAMRRQRTDDYWSLRLPRETREYVPQFLAAMEIASDPERYGFELPTSSPFRFDEVLIRGPVDLKHVSGITAIPFEELKELNPMFVRHRAPAGQGGTSIRVPKGRGNEVQELLQSFYKPKPLSKSELREASRGHSKELRHHPRRHRGKHTHLVRRGETLSGIGKRYGKPPTTIARLNRISDSGHLRAGQRIRIQ